MTVHVRYFLNLNTGARFLKTVKGAISIGNWAETVGETTSKGVNLVANDWVKNRSLRIYFKSMWLNVQSNP